MATAPQRKFKDGDTVKLIRSEGPVPKDSTGIVRGLENGYYAVEWDNFNNGHDCKMGIPDRKGYFTGVNQLAKITPKTVVRFEDVILSEEKRRQIVEALQQIHQQDLIFTTWGFEKTIEKGKGISMLFYGPPGTGKTLMGQAIADKLDYKLKVISTADIESSEPGQAERNIRQHFKGQKSDKTIMLFDECDSLIYDRTSVGAILGAQVNELLSNLEKFEGITIFTTNRLGVLDEAVNRRLALKLEFAMPTLDERVAIWKRMFPEEAPMAKNIDWKRLAKVAVTGGYIKNIALRSARIAATEPKPDKEKKISMKHMLRALKEEVESMAEFSNSKNDVPHIVGQQIGAGRDLGQNMRKVAQNTMSNAGGL